MGTFYPLVSKSMALPAATGPFATALFFVIGVALCALPVNYFFMRMPIDGGTPVTMRDYIGASSRWHMAGILGGMIWVCGATLNFAASRVNFVGPAISYSMHSGGKGANQAVAVARLGYPSILLGAVGDDMLGRDLLSTLADFGVVTQHIRSATVSSGTASIVVDAKSENTIIVTPSANLQVTPDYLRTKLEVLHSAGMVLNAVGNPAGHDRVARRMLCRI